MKDSHTKATPASAVHPEELSRNGEERGADESMHGAEGIRTLRLLADRPITDPEHDLLDYHPLAEALSAILLDPDTDTPLTMSISAPWGAGKTSLAHLTEFELNRGEARADAPHPVVVKFNAWQNDKSEDIGSAFAAAVARDLGPHRNWLRRVLNPIPIGMLSRRGRVSRRLLTGLSLLALVVILVLTLIQTELITQFDEEALGVGVFPGLPLAAAVGIWLWGRLNTLSQTLSAYISAPDVEAGKGAISEVRLQLGRLIGQVVNRARPQRVVVFVDDLDRAHPPRSIDVCEKAAQLLDHDGVIVVFLADVPALEAAATNKYAEGTGGYVPRDGMSDSGDNEPNRYGRIYLQKLVQFQINLPPATPDQIKLVASRIGMAGSEPETRLRRFWRLSDDGKRMVRLGSLTGSVYVLMITCVLFAFSVERLAWVWWTLAALFGVAQVWLFRRASRDEALRKAVVGRYQSLGFGGTGGVASALLPISVVLLTVYVVTIAVRATDWAWAWWIGSIFLAIVALGSIGMLIENVEASRRERFEKRIRAKVKHLIEARAAQDEEAVSNEKEWYREIVYELLETDDKLGRYEDPSLLENLVLEATAEFIAVDSQARRQAEREVVAHLTPLPRSAKRLVNRLRFILHVSQRKGLLQSCLAPEEVGKWAVLVERWPSLSWSITLNPELLASMETAAATNGDLSELVSDESVSIPDLKEFLLAGETRLGEAVEALVYLRDPRDRN